MGKKINNLIALILLATGLAGCATAPHGSGSGTSKPEVLFLREMCERNNVSWELDNVSQVVTLSYENRSAKLMVGSPVILIGGVRSELSAPLKIIRSAIVVPVDFEPKVIDQIRQKTIVEKLYYVPSVKKVVIDAGHGGKDPGALGVSREQEKKIALDIAQRVRKNLEKKGINVKMTRSTDVFISLNDRTEMASRESADLFVSIHANSSPSRAVTGIEVYTLKDLDSVDRKVEQRVINQDIFFRNLKMNRNDSNLKRIVADMLYNHKQDRSLDLAEKLIRNTTLATKAKNLGKKTSRFFVVRNTLVPAVLIETGFMSNPREERSLKSSSYRQTLADAVAEGIISYINE